MLIEIERRPSSTRKDERLGLEMLSKPLIKLGMSPELECPKFSVQLWVLFDGIVHREELIGAHLCSAGYLEHKTGVRIGIEKLQGGRAFQRHLTTTFHDAGPWSFCELSVVDTFCQRDHGTQADKAAVAMETTATTAAGRFIGELRPDPIESSGIDISDIAIPSPRLPFYW